MPHPVKRATASRGGGADAPPTDALAPSADEASTGWRDNIAAFPDLFADIDEGAAPEDASIPDLEAADLQASLMEDLEAVAAAFWMELGPDLSAPDLAVGLAGRDWHSPANAPDSQSGEPSEPGSTRFFMPEPRGRLIDFRPPRARKRRTDRTAHAESELRAVKGDVAAGSPGGAFADDLAARNKEFYELLKGGGASPRKISIPAADRRTDRIEPGFGSTFTKAPPVVPPPAVAVNRRKRGDTRRQALAVAVLLLVVGAGAALITVRSTVTDDQAPALALTDPEPVASFPPGDPEAEAAPIVGAPPHPGASDPLATASVPPIDPGTLATPPLYESAEEASQRAIRPVPEPQPSVDGLATIPLRTDAPGAGIGGDRPQPSVGEATGSLVQRSADIPSDAPESAALAEDDPVPVEEEALTVETETAPAEPVELRPQPPAPKETPSVVAAAPPPAEPAAGNSRLLKLPPGPATVTVSVNMRAGPDNGEKVVRVLRAGTPVEVVACKFWCEVIADGERGWVYQRFIGRHGETAQAPDLVPAPPAEEPSRMPIDLLRFLRPNGTGAP